MQTHIGRIGGRLKRGVISSCGILIAAFILKPDASAITVQVSTSKPQYYEGEVIYILVAVPEVATLQFWTSCQVNYVMDQTFTPPLTCAQVLTSRTTPYTWTIAHRWYGYDVGLGNHSVVGQVIGYGFSPPATFQVIPPPPPPADFLIDFDTLPGTTAPISSLNAYDAYGAHFHTIENADCQLSSSVNPTNHCLTGFDSYPVGFNVGVSFAMPVFGASAKVTGGSGYKVTMTAKNAAGQTIAVATSPTITNVYVFKNTISVKTSEPIATLEWQSGAANSGVYVDDLFVVTTPLLTPCLMDAATLRLTCPTVADAHYQLWSSTDLRNWTPCGPACLGNGNVLTNDVPVTGSPSRFFRITKDN